MGRVGQYRFSAFRRDGINNNLFRRRHNNPADRGCERPAPDLDDHWRAGNLLHYLTGKPRCAHASRYENDGI